MRNTAEGKAIVDITTDRDEQIGELLWMHFRKFARAALKHAYDQKIGGVSGSVETTGDLADFAHLDRPQAL